MALRSGRMMRNQDAVPGSESEGPEDGLMTVVKRELSGQSC